MRRLALIALIGLIFGCGVDTNPPAPAALPKTDTTRRIDDPDLDAAIAAARKTLDKFIARLQHPQRGEVFSIEGAFAAPDGSHEHVWLGDVAYRDGIFTGLVTSKPEKPISVKFGEKASVKLADVTDWMILKGGASEGGYTVDLLLRRQGQPR